MSDLIMYYTRSNNTKTVAEIIANKVGGDLLEIIDNKKRNGPIRYLTSLIDVSRDNPTTVTYHKVDLNQYDTIYVGTPVWMSKPAPAINKFIEENDFTGLDVVTFATMASSGGESTTSIMNEEISKKGGNVIKSFAVTAKEDMKTQTLNYI